jgi:hypothetical protein
MRSLLLGIALLFLVLGCNQSAPTVNEKTTPAKEGGVKVRAPGVNVDVGKEDGKRKVDVEVK